MQVLKKIPDELDKFDGDLVIAVVGEDERPLRATNSWLDWRLYGTLTDLLARKVFAGRLGEKCMIPTYGKFSFDRLVLVGGGNLYEASLDPSVEVGQERWHQIADVIDKTLNALKIKRVGLSLPRFEISDHERALMKLLQSSSLPVETALFFSRVPQYGTALH